MASNAVEDVSEESERKYRAPALEKGLDILELLAREGEPLTTSQIASKLDRSVSELFRMVLTLDARGYITQIGDRDGYGLTNKMFSLGIAQTSKRNLIEIAVPVMKALAGEIAQSCHLTVESNNQIVVIARIESSRDMGFSVRVGYRRPLPQSTSGALLVGMRAEPEMQRWLDQLAASTDEFLMSVFRGKVQKARELGYVQSPSDFVHGVTDLSSPVYGSTGVIAALTVPYVNCTPVVCPLEDAMARLREATAEISDLLKVEEG